MSKFFIHRKEDIDVAINLDEIRAVGPIIKRIISVPTGETMTTRGFLGRRIKTPVNVVKTKYSVTVVFRDKSESTYSSEALEDSRLFINTMFEALARS